MLPEAEKTGQGKGRTGDFWASTGQEKGGCLAVNVFCPSRKEKGNFKGNVEIIRAATLVTGLGYKGSFPRQPFLQETVMFLTSADLYCGAAFPENYMIRLICQPSGSQSRSQASYLHLWSPQSHSNVIHIRCV